MPFLCLRDDLTFMVRLTGYPQLPFFKKKIFFELFYAEMGILTYPKCGSR